MKFVERIQKKLLLDIVNLNKHQFRFELGKETADSLFVLKRMEEY